MRILCALGFAVLALLGRSATAAELELSKLAWLAGCWNSESAESGSVEHWLPLAGGSMLGVSRTVKKGVTVAFEFMELRTLADGTLAFIAHPSAQRSATFSVLRISETEAVFENMQHDFPQRVIYARGGEFQLSARIEGMRNGRLKVIDFPMRRVSCDQLAGGVEK